MLAMARLLYIVTESLSVKESMIMGTYWSQLYTLSLVLLIK